MTDNTTNTTDPANPPCRVAASDQTSTTTRFDEKSSGTEQPQPPSTSAADGDQSKTSSATPHISKTEPKEAKSKEETGLSMPPHSATTSQSAPCIPLRRRYALLAAALAIPLLFDRLFISGSVIDGTTLFQAFGRWCALITLTGVALFVMRARRTVLWWITGAAALAMSIWLMTVTAQTAAFRIPPANLSYALATALIMLPATLMIFLQLSSETFNAHRPSGLILDWLRGWTISWFTHLPLLTRTCSDTIGVVTDAKDSDGKDSGGKTHLQIGRAHV